METAALSAELLAAAPGIALRLRAILAALAALVAHAFLRDPRHVALIIPLWTRINRTARRFERLMARLAAGTPSRPSRPGSASGPRPPALPASHAWLVVAIGHMAAGYASQLRHLLAEPEAAALIAASPQAARILRPLCHMLGVRPACIPPLPRRVAIEPVPRVEPPPRRAALPALPFERPRVLPPLCPRAAERWPWCPHPNAKPT